MQNFAKMEFLHEYLVHVFTLWKKQNGEFSTSCDRYNMKYHSSLFQASFSTKCFLEIVAQIAYKHTNLQKRQKKKILHFQ